MRHSIRIVTTAVVWALATSSVAPLEPPEDGAVFPGRDWTLVGGDWTNARYSTLTQINPSNLASLAGAWTKSFDDGASSRATPVVKSGRMLLTAGARVYTLDAKSGATLWTWKADAAGSTPNVADTSGLVAALNTGGLALPSPPGVALGGGLVFVGLMDGRVAALEQASGRLVWTRQTGEDPPQRGQSVSGPPTYARGVVFSGLANGDWALRGRVVALDARSGRELWHFFVVPGPGEPGHETWPADNDVWKQGGGGVWHIGTVDPELGMVFFGTGNTVPVTGGEIRAGDNLYTNSVVALDMKTGKVRWSYQVIHHDLWDTDIPTPVMLYEAQVEGRSRKALAAMRPDGYLFLLDRATGKPLHPIEERPVPQDARLKTSPTQPFPIGADKLVPECETWRAKVPAPFELSCPGFAPPSWDRHTVLMPAVRVRVTPMSYSPQTGYIYGQGIGALSWPRRISDDPWFWGGGGDLSLFGLRHTAVLAAIDGRTNKIVWRKEFAAPSSLNGSGPLTTASGLMFRVAWDGRFEADDARTGATLWQFQTGVPSGRGPAMTYEVDGEQYLAAAIGPAMWALEIGGTIPQQPTRLPAVNPDADSPGEATAEIEAATLVTPCCVQGGRRWAVDEYAFKPLRGRTRTGTRITFMNNGRLPHSFVSRDGSWRTGVLQPGQEASLLFDKPGTYTFTCEAHPWSIGRLTVEDPSSSAGGRPFGSTRQAERGKREFLAGCASCHGDALGGTNQVPALSGGAFLLRWSGRTAGDLFDKIRTTMPPTAPGSLAPAASLDIVAYLLQANGLNAGTSDAEPNAVAWRAFRIW